MESLKCLGLGVLLPTPPRRDARRGSPSSGATPRFYNMRKLALDVGSKRIGVAVSDATNTLAQPLTTIERSDLSSEVNQIKHLMEEYEIDEIIAGLPIDLKGEHGIAAENVDTYLNELEQAIGKQIIRIDERLTTKIAGNMLRAAGLKKEKRKKVIDELAATIILQSYLEKK